MSSIPRITSRDKHTAYFDDFAQILNILNRQLQGKMKHLMDVIGAKNAFEGKLLLRNSLMNKPVLSCFPNMTTKLEVMIASCILDI
jgi:hypothetical protein